MLNDLEDFYINRSQSTFDNASPEKRKKEVERAHGEALRIKENVELYVSPEDIIPGMDTKGIARLSEAYKNKPVQDKGRGHKGEIGEDYETPHTGKVHAALWNDWEKNEGKKFKLVRDLFRGMPIVDLGSGETEMGLEIAKMLGASGYVGVEPHNWNSLEYELIRNEGPGGYPKKFKKPKGIPYSVVPEDALTFLRRLPDKSVGVMSIGTDHFVFYGGRDSWVTASDSDQDKEDKKNIAKYIEDCKKEIIRVLHPRSALLAIESMFQDISEGDDLYVSEAESILPTRENYGDGFYIIKSKSH